MLNTSEDAKAPVVIPDPNRVAVISALVRYSQIKQESKEPVPYFLTVFNEALQIQQQLWLRTLFSVRNMAVRSKSTPYVELIGALEVRISLNRQSNEAELIPPQTLRAFYVRKWGGKSETSHLPDNVRLWITKNFQEDENLTERLPSESDKTRMIVKTKSNTGTGIQP